MIKSQTTAFLLLLFHTGKFIFCQKTHLVKLNLYCYTFALLFFHVVGYWKCSKTNSHIDIHWFCRRHTSIQNTLQQTGYFNVDFDSNGLFLLFIYFRQVSSIQEKNYINLGNQFHYKKYKERNRDISKTFVFIFRHSI